MAFTTLFDACVLYSPTLRDVLLSLAVTDLFRTRWSDRIQDEWMQSVIRSKPDLAAVLPRTRHLMETAVPDASVTGYEALESGLVLPDHNDRHVLAAAIIGRADVIVTTNLRHFPPACLGPFGIEAQHPDDFIAHVLTLAPAIALAAIKDMRARLVTPAFAPEAFLERWRRRNRSVARGRARGGGGLMDFPAARTSHMHGISSRKIHGEA